MVLPWFLGALPVVLPVLLKVNGISLGKKPVPLFGVVEYDTDAGGQPIVFKPGKLEATSWDAGGNVLSTQTVATTGPAAGLRLSLDAPGIDGIRYSGPAAVSAVTSPFPVLGTLRLFARMPLCALVILGKWLIVFARSTLFSSLPPLMQ